ncbi:hypothetical protein KP509_23G036000 [Ceratopteris richardii]|uniref:N-terminal acetyltransferase B complex auxiliary subunit NAA25 n=1 Tax=Ceratopteris richardii TaxID=49495 RepID=A0A8T2S1R4_CERRI|nr:hypothetical protein KP509_23G036000 [Ceratopteris richardii]
MSSRGGNSVAERRLRPLWDAIDCRQYKTALKLATSLLSKHPDSTYLIVLKALVLERMGKTDEALDLCKQAKESEPIDDLTLSTLQIVYQRLGHPNEASVCYEKACRKVPNNLELMVGLFCCYVRDYSFLKQQQVAMKMHKLFAEERFLLWAVCSIQLQVSCDKKDRALLALAEAFLKKRYEAHGFEELEALVVYLALLENEGKYQTALDVLSSKAGDLFSIRTDRLKLEGKLLLSSHKYDLAAKVFKEVLEMSSDDWAMYFLYLDAILELSHNNAGINGNSMIDSNSDFSLSGLSIEESEGRLQSAKGFIEGLQIKESHGLKRGPFLANIEIEKRRFLLSLQGEYQKPTANLLQRSIVDYFKRFGHLASFTTDIQGYLTLIPLDCRDSLLQSLRLCCTEIEGDSSVALLRRKISLFQMQLQFSSQSTSDKGIMCQAVEVTKLYAESVKLSRDLDPQENMWGEELVTLAATFLIQLFLRTRHPGYVVEVIMLLEFGLAIRKHSFPYKTMLISLYSTMVCPSLAFEWFKTMDVKNILVETLSHHILLPLTRSMHWSEFESVLGETLKFHEDCAKEAADLTIVAYKQCNYTKVLEFVHFTNRLQRSHNLLLSKIEGVILQLREKSGVLDDILTSLERLEDGNMPLRWSTVDNLADLSFNESLETRPWWSPAPGQCLLTEAFNQQPFLQDEEIKAQPFLQHKEIKAQAIARESNWRTYVHKRCLLPRILHLALNVIRFREVGPNNSAAIEYDNELHDLVKKYAKSLGLEGDEFFGDTLSNSFLKNGEPSDIFSLVLFWTCSEFVFRKSSQALPNLNELAKIYVTKLTSFAKVSDTESWKPSLADITYSWTCLPLLLMLVTEGFMWYSICLQSWFRHLQPGGKTSKKKKKGVVMTDSLDAMAESDRAALLLELKSVKDSFCNVLKELLHWLTNLLKSLDGQYECVLVEHVSDRVDGSFSADFIDSLVPGTVYNALKSSMNSAAGTLGDRVDALVQTFEVRPLIQRIESSVSANLHKLSDFLRSLIDGLQS